MILPQVRTVPERRFNNSLKRIRVWIEHTFGCWKKMFPILLVCFRKYKCINSLATIYASAVLYNISRDLNEETPPLPKSISQKKFDRLMRNSFNNTPANDHNQQNFVRNQIIAQHFSNPRNRNR